MFRFFRDGFYKDFIVLMLVTIFVGTMFASGVAWAVDSYFGDAITEMIGDYGEYDVILHIREEAEEAALRELERVANEQFPGARINKTLTIAGQSNFFFGFPEEFKKPEVFESLPNIFNGIPGLNGYTVIVEPSILIRGVHASVRGELRDEIEQIPGVSFAFRDNVNMLVVLDSMEYSREVSNKVEEILQGYQILELRFPMRFEVDTNRVASQAIEVLESETKAIRLENVTSAEHGEDLDAFLKTLVEMRNFLLSYASKVRIEASDGVHLIEGEQLILQGTSDIPLMTGEEKAPGHVVVDLISVTGKQAEGIIVEGSIADAPGVLSQAGFRVNSSGQIGASVASVNVENERYRLTYAINESLRLLRELEELALEADVAVDNADAILDTFQEALMQLEVLQIQISQLNEGMNQNSGSSPSEQLLISLLVNGLLKGLTQSVGPSEISEDAALENLENLDVAAMRGSIENISEQIRNVQDIDIQAIIDQIEHVRDSLPQLDDEEIGTSIKLINTYIAGQVIPGERVQILLHGDKVDEKELEPLLRDRLDNPYLNTYSVSVGMINPDARSELLRVLQEVRATIAGILAVVFTIGVLILDHATIFSTLKYIGQNRRIGKSRLARLFDATKLFGAGVGMLLLLLVYTLSGAEIPMINSAGISLVGLIIGVGTVAFAEKFSPVHSSEIMAGQALGLANVQIMREIVVPASRPGLLNLLNRLKQRF